MRIEIKNLDFGYSEDNKILHDINLVLEGSKLVCIIGPNGVGKSTLVKCINKLLKPTSGQILIDGVDVSTMSQKEVAKLVGFVPANSQDCFAMPVLDAVLLGTYNRQGWRTSKKDLDYAHSTLKLLDMDQFAMRSFNELSAGQHQKVSLARGLVQDTPCIILDEPTANLDVMHQMYVTELLKDISAKKGILTIMICHDLNIAAQFADELIVLTKPGVVHSVGIPEEVITPDTIRDVYGIDSTVITHNGAPHVILEPTFADENEF